MVYLELYLSHHPITRFLVKHFYQSHQEQYETHMHYLARYMDKKMLRNLQKDVVYQMKQHADYKAFYFRPVMAKYYRELRQEYEYLESIMGENKLFEDMCTRRTSGPIQFKLELGSDTNLEPHADPDVKREFRRERESKHCVMLLPYLHEHGD
ncbi:unnamed protein product [Darwinula stevensoni]|uniref:NADH dehydrogenase [ubiquinone] 1 beta subcomplex subunit 5, mitochondrial n=1 Tax=Darwinula stevensoni TaxID=69355 RepID=A0A7R8X374_9CRUS|nr:unnamed protein product [Darwinula stevensoni]CAG0882231.1 unnamed protein product [Darwinula stevensoni]